MRIVSGSQTIGEINMNFDFVGGCFYLVRPNIIGGDFELQKFNWIKCVWWMKHKYLYWKKKGTLETIRHQGI